MPESWNLSQNYSIDLITAEYLSVEMGKDPLLSVLPITSSKENLVIWEQPENGYGLLSARGQNAAPDVTGVAGWRQYRMAPGYYGEKTIITETQMLNMREPGTPNEVIDKDKLIMNGIIQISRRATDRIRMILSLLFRTGKFQVYSRTGAVTHADAIDGYNTFIPTIPWSTSATATPIADLLGWQNTLQTGTSSKFGSGSKILMSDVTVNELFATAEIRSVFKLNYGQTPLGLEGVNTILNGFGLPKIERYNEGYYPTEALAKARTGFIKHIPSRAAIWVGERPEGVPIGSFVLTRNLVGEAPIGGREDLSYENGKVKNGLAEGIYTLLDYFQKPPVRMELDIGFNGGPAIRYPSALAGISY